MKLLFRYELKKILRSKTSLITMIAGLLICISFSAFEITQAYYMEGREAKEVKGIAGIKVSMEKDNAKTDALTNEYLQKMLQDYQSKISVPHEDDPDFEFWMGYANRVELGYIAAAYADKGSNWEWEDLKEIEAGESFDFYSHRDKKMKEAMEGDYQIGNYTQEERDFWYKKAAEVKTPLEWGGKQAWTMINHAVGMMFYLLIFACICVAPIFATEYHLHTDAILLTTKYGKSKLITVKIVVAVLFSFFYLLTGICVMLGIVISAAGIQGYNLPVQLWGLMSPYNMEIWQLMLIQLGITLLVGITLGAFNAFLSARTKSSFTTLILDTLVVLAPAFFPYSNTNRLYNQVLDLLPIRCIGVLGNMTFFNSYQFGKLVITDITMTVIVYSIVFIICILLTINGFRKHQVRNMLG